MLYEHFQVNRPVGTGHSRPNDVKRLRRVLHETGYNTSPPVPSGRYDASASAAIERFQRDLGLKPDGVVLPGGPTERALDLALAARREGGPDEQAQLRDVFRIFADAGLTFRPADPDDDRPGRFVDKAGHEAGPDRLVQILEARAQTGRQKPEPTTGDPAERSAGPDAAGTLSTTAAPALHPVLPRLPAVPPVLWPLIGLGAAVREQMARVGPETAAAERDAATAPLLDRAARQRVRRDGTPNARTIDDEAGLILLPGGSEPPRMPNRTEFPGEPPKGPDDHREEYPATPRQPTILPGPEIQEARPGIFIFPDLQGEFDDLSIVERRGNEKTRAELEKVRDYVWEHILGGDPNWEHVAGGRRVKKDGTIEEVPERWIPGPQKAMEPLFDKTVDGRKGGKFVDLTFENKKTGETVHVQTVDGDKYGKPTVRELDNAEVIRRATKDGRVYLFVKGTIPK